MQPKIIYIASNHLSPSYRCKFSTQCESVLSLLLARTFSGRPIAKYWKFFRKKNKQLFLDNSLEEIWRKINLSKENADLHPTDDSDRFNQPSTNQHENEQ